MYLVYRYTKCTIVISIAEEHTMSNGEGLLIILFRTKQIPGLLPLINHFFHTFTLKQNGKLTVFDQTEQYKIINTASVSVFNSASFPSHCSCCFYTAILRPHDQFIQSLCYSGNKYLSTFLDTLILLSLKTYFLNLFVSSISQIEAYVPIHAR